MRRPTAMSTGTSDSSDRTTLRSRIARKRPTKAIDQVGEQSTRFASRFSSRPTPTTARPDGVALTPWGALRGRRGSLDDLAPLEPPGAVAEDDVERVCCGRGPVDGWTSFGATS